MSLANKACRKAIALKSFVLLLETARQLFQT